MSGKERHHWQGVAAVFAMGVLLAGAGSFPARAAHADVSSLRSDWNISTIKGSETSENGLQCSMKAGYGNGHTLVFARNGAGVNSVAIDFGQAERFDAGRQYTLTLSLPSRLQRKETAVAATPQILIFQAGHDPALYNAIRRSARMTVSGGFMQGGSYSYSLSGSSAALDDLDDCVRSINPAYVPDALQVSEMQVVPPDFANIEPASGNPGLQISVESDDGLSPLPGARDISAEALQAEQRAIELEKQAMLAKIEAEKIKAEQARREADELVREQQEKTAMLEKMHAEEKQRADELARKNAETEARMARLIEDQKRTAQEKERLEVSLKDRNEKVAVLESQKEQLASSIEPALSEETISTGTSAGNFFLRNALLAAKVADRIDEDADYSDIPGLAGYRWQSDDGVFGSVQRLSWRPGAGFDDMITNYLETIGDRCPADFAATPAAGNTLAGREFKTAEIACMGLSGSESAAALLFIHDGDQLLVISHESVPDRIGAGVSRRAAVLKAIRDSVTG